jgi:hypothetical protein
MAESRWSAELRNLKIEIVSGERKIEISEAAKRKHAEELRFIGETFLKEDVITGSLALNLYGLIDRKVGDIDIMIQDRKRYSGYVVGIRYGEPEDGEMKLSNRLGSKEFKQSRKGLIRYVPFFRNARIWEVDFFEADPKYVAFEFEGREYRVQEPMAVVETKCVLEENSIKRVRYSYDDDPDSPKEKHCRDLMCIFG